MSRRLQLTALDLVFCGQQPLPIQMVFLFKRIANLARLRETLQESLRVYWPLNGVLKHDDEATVILEETGRPVARYDERSVTEFDDETLNSTDSLKSFVLPPESTFDSAVASFLWTHWKDGAALGVSLSHAVVDGYSFFLFMTDWARRARGLTSPTPVIERTALQFPANPNIELTDERLYDLTGLYLDKTESKTRVSPYQTLRLSEDELTALRREAEAQTSTRLSDNDLVCAQLARKVAAEMASDYFSLTMPIDIRRIYKGLGPTYFGNALRPTGLRMKRELFLNLPFGEIASRIGQGVRSLHAESIPETYAYLEGIRQRYGLNGFQSMKVVDPSRGLLVTNLSRLPLTEIDFGFEAATDLRLLTPMAGAAAVLPSHSKEMLIQISL